MVPVTLGTRSANAGRGAGPVRKLIAERNDFFERDLAVKQYVSVPSSPSEPRLSAPEIHIGPFPTERGLGGRCSFPPHLVPLFFGTPASNRLRELLKPAGTSRLREC